jgi:hypothetical protein
MIAPSDPVLAGVNVTPKSISGMLVVSRQLLIQKTGPELDRILINDLSRQLASYLDLIKALCMAADRWQINRRA